MRVSGTDSVEGGWDIDQTIAFAKALGARDYNLYYSGMEDIHTVLAAAY